MRLLRQKHKKAQNNIVIKYNKSLGEEALILFYQLRILCTVARVFRGCSLCSQLLVKTAVADEHNCTKCNREWNEQLQTLFATAIKMSNLIRAVKQPLFYLLSVMPKI